MENNFKADWPSFALGFNTGKSKGGGVELNIAYGDTPPEDTSKIWVKSQKPEKVRVEPLKFSETFDYPYEVALHYVNRACVSFDNKIYMFGGLNNVGSTTGISTVYDTVTKETKPIASPPRFGALTRAVTNGNDVHFFADGYWSVFFQDREAWGNGSTSIPADYRGAACCCVDGFVYFFGGGSSAKTTIGKLNLETKEFSGCEAAFTSARNYISCVAIGPKIYLFGGINSSKYSMSSAMCYDTTNDSLSNIKTMPTAKYDMGCLAYGDDILLVGGRHNDSKGTTYFDEVMIYRPSTDEYLLCDGTLSNKRLVEGCVMVGDKVYLTGVYATEYAHEIETFRVAPPVENGAIAMHLKTSGTKIPIINDETVHIETEIGGTYFGDENGVGQPVEALMFKDGEWTNI